MLTDKQKTYRREYYKINRERINKRRFELRKQKDKNVLLKRYKLNYKKNKESILKRQKQYYYKNRTLCLIKQKEYNKLHKEDIKQKNIIYYMNNYKNCWINCTLYDHKYKGYTIIITKEELLNIVNNSLVCFYCDKKLNWNKKEGRLTHDSPSLDRLNGENILTKDNVVICCHSCNSTKRNRTFDEFKNYCKKITEKFN